MLNDTDLFRTARVAAAEVVQNRLGPDWTVVLVPAAMHPNPSLRPPSSDKWAKPVLNVAEVAELLGRSRSSIRDMCQKGTLPAKKLNGAWHVRLDLLLQLLGPERYPRANHYP